MPDVLGASEREQAAIAELGQWRSRLRSRCLLGFALAGVALGGVGYWVAQELQFRHNDGVALAHVNGAGAAIPFLILLAAGVVFSRVLSRRLAPRMATKLAAKYGIPADEVAKFAAMSSQL